MIEKEICVCYLQNEYDYSQLKMSKFVKRSKTSKEKDPEPQASFFRAFSEQATFGINGLISSLFKPPKSEVLSLELQDSQKYYYQKRKVTRQELYNKLEMMSTEDWIELQQKSLLLMKERVKLKTEYHESLKNDLFELKDNQKSFPDPILEMEMLEKEISELARENEQLKSKWAVLSNVYNRNELFKKLLDFKPFSKPK